MDQHPGSTIERPLGPPDRPVPEVTSASIYPSFNALYYSGYLQGVYDAFGADRLRFTTSGFPDLGHDCLALRVRANQGERNIYIHAHDSTSLPLEALEWADVFGKVNLDRSLVPGAAAGKVLPIGPTMPVRLWGPIETARRAIHSVLVINKRLISYRRLDNDLLVRPVDRSLPECVKLHLIHYAKLFTHRRLPLHEYVPGASRADYIFFSSGLWPETHEIPEWATANARANKNRVVFIEACRAIPGVVFEGGFWERRKVRVSNYEHFTSPVDYSHDIYIEKTRSSAVVFNTPAFKECHSWKLAEFFALGKAIVSLPIVREMPAPLVHGEHIHYVDDSVGSIRDAVVKICAEHEYRRHLEANARAYYEEWLRPDVVIRRLVAAAFD